MYSKSKPHFIAYICTLSLTLVFTILLTLSFVFSFDSDIGYLSAKNALPTVMRIFAFASFGGIAVFGFSFCKSEKCDVSENHSSYKVICISVGAVAVLCAGALTVIGGVNIKNILISVGILCLGGYISCTGFDCSAYSTPKFVLLSASVLAYAVTAYKNYTDFSRPINSSENVIYSCISIIMLLFILTELKVMLGRRSDFHFASMLAGFFANFSCSVSYFIAYACGKVANKEFLSLMILSLALSIYLQSKLVRTIPQRSPSESQRSGSEE